MRWQRLLFFRTPLSTQELSDLIDYVFALYPSAIDNAS